MPQVRITRTVWDAFDDGQKDLIRHSPGMVALGEPAIGLVGGVETCVWDSSKLTVDDCGAVAAAVKNASSFRGRQIPTRTTVDVEGNETDTGQPDREQSRADARLIVEARVRVSEVEFVRIVERDVPEREWRDVPVRDENGDPTGETVRRLVKTGRTITVEVEEPAGDPAELVVRAQNAPASVTAGASLPDDWTPIVEPIRGRVDAEPVGRRG